MIPIDYQMYIFDILQQFMSRYKLKKIYPIHIPLSKNVHDVFLESTNFL